MSKYAYSAIALVVLGVVVYAFLSPIQDRDTPAPAPADAVDETGPTTTATSNGLPPAPDPITATATDGSTAGQSPADPVADTTTITTSTTKTTGGTTGSATARATVAGLSSIADRAGLADNPDGPRSLQDHLDALGLSLADIPIQSPARPHDMDIMAPVLASETDDRYNRFVNEALPEINAFLKDLFKDRPNIDANTENMLLEDLLLEQPANVRVYFVKEGTVFHNTLGIVHDDQNKIIFPDASSRISYFRDAETRNEYTSEEVPLLPGDYVDLGVIDQGELLDLFLIQDGARNEDGNVYYVDTESNADGVNHVKFHGVYNENTLLIGFEDLKGGGDRDYNDLVIAVELTPP